MTRAVFSQWYNCLQIIQATAQVGSSEKIKETLKQCPRLQFQCQRSSWNEINTCHQASVTRNLEVTRLKSAICFKYPVWSRAINKTLQFTNMLEISWGNINEATVCQQRRARSEVVMKKQNLPHNKEKKKSKSCYATSQIDQLCFPATLFYRIRKTNEFSKADAK